MGDSVKDFSLAERRRHLHGGMALYRGSAPVWPIQAQHYQGDRVRVRADSARRPGDLYITDLRGHAQTKLGSYIDFLAPQMLAEMKNQMPDDAATRWWRMRYRVSSRDRGEPEGQWPVGQRRR
jgi:hypothetical protein